MGGGNHYTRSTLYAFPPLGLPSRYRKRCRLKTPQEPAVFTDCRASGAVTINTLATAPITTMRRSFPALFVRGGTSNGIIVKRDYLPTQDRWSKVLPAAMGSPDPYGRQLDGMGSGISSTSKICILSSSDRTDADVDFTFIQVGIRDGILDSASNCGNMSSAVGPAAWDLGLVIDASSQIRNGEDHQEAVVRIFNTNTAKLIISRFKVAGNPPLYCQKGNYKIDGVPGGQSRITLRFMHPAGAKTGKALPTGNAVDVLRLSNGNAIEASLVDVSNPGVFVRAVDLGFHASASGDLSAVFNPGIVESDPALKSRLEDIRRAGAEKMGLDPIVESVPKVVVLYPARSSDDVDIQCLALSMGQAHKSVPLTLALCLGAAATLPGTIAANLVKKRSQGKDGSVSIGHPSGRIEIGTVIRDGEIISADLHRTARFLMQGNVLF